MREVEDGKAKKGGEERMKEVIYVCLVDTCCP